MAKSLWITALLCVAGGLFAGDNAPDKAKALDAVKGTVKAALSSGKKVEVYLTVLGSPQKVEVLSSDPKFLTIKLQNNPFPLSWEKISAEQMAGVAKACVMKSGSSALALADYCIATQQRDKADEALLLAASLEKNLAPQIAERMTQIKAMNAPTGSAIAASGVGPKAPPPPKVAPMMAAPTAKEMAIKAKAEAMKSDRATFFVAGIEFGVLPITNAFKKIEGVKECYGDQDRGTVTLSFDPTLATIEKIIETFNSGNSEGSKTKAYKPGETPPEPEYVYTDKEESIRGTMAIRLPESSGDVVCRVVAQRNGEPRRRAFNLLGSGEIAKLIEETRQKGAEVTVVGVVTKEGIKVSKISE